MSMLQPTSHALQIGYTALDHDEAWFAESHAPLASPVRFHSKDLTDKRTSSCSTSQSSDHKSFLSSRSSVKVPELQSTAQKKLIQASAICALFMIIESIAGWWSNSLALLTDASHLLSDLCSFLISLFALWVATLPGTRELSFGYHRAEILGALISVVVIWILTVFLNIEAYRRLSTPSTVNGGIMFITAFFGTLANLVMTYILGLHNHGLNTSCSHHASHHSGHLTNEFWDCERGKENSPATPSLQESSPHSIFNDIHCSASPYPEAPESPSCSLKSASLTHTAHPKTSPHSLPRSPNDSAHHTLDGGHKVMEDQPSLLPSLMPSNHEGLSSLVLPLIESTTPGHTMLHPQTHANVNLRAAYLHAAGDLIQNIGVLLAATLIWFNPSWYIVDPLCTFLFSLLVIGTTFSILLEAMNVLMEGVPKEVNVSSLKEDLQRLPSVTEIHDLHVWSLSLGRPSLACHVVVDSHRHARRVLRQATQVCQKNYGILHTTIQIDYSANKQSCDTDAHTKCH